MSEIVARKFEIRSNDVLGRYAVATDNYKCGELVLCETSRINVPDWTTKLCCLSCFKLTNRICADCNMIPVCMTCAIHDPVECDFMRNSKLDQNFILEHINAIFLLRCILKYYHDEASYNEIIQMESHLAMRKGTDIWKLHENTIINPLLEQKDFVENCKLKITKELLHQFCGILDVNSFEVRGNLDDFNNITIVRSIYSTAALLAHDCQCNTFVTIDKSFNMRIIAAVPIKKGDQIFFNYTKSLWGTLQRRKHLREGKYFECKCRRCLDPTELGTHLSSLLCKSCPQGYLTLRQDESKSWKCDKCEGSISFEKAALILKTCEDELEAIDLALKPLETFIKKYTKMLAPTHWLILEAKQKLAGVLRAIHNKHSMEGMVTAKNILQRKLELCNELLPILRVLEPGISRLTSIALYEKQSSLIELAERNYQFNEITTAELLQILSEAELLLKEAISMLIYEAKSTPEGHLVQRALMEMKELRNHMKDILEIHLEEQRELQDEAKKLKKSKNKKNVNKN